MPSPLEGLSPRLLGHARTVVTLAVLALLLVYGVSHGLRSVTAPFPELSDPPVCVDTTVTDGDVLRPGAITVSVLNAGERTGLAGVTLDDLEAQGFARGRISTLTDEDVARAEIWSPEGRTPVTRLVASYLGGSVRVVERTASVPGVAVVVGDRFPGVKPGLAQAEVGADVTVCSPPELS